MAAARFALCTTALAVAGLVITGDTDAAAPTIEADGDNLVATVGARGNVIFTNGAQVQREARLLPSSLLAAWQYRLGAQH